MSDVGGGPVELGEVAAAADLAPSRQALITVLTAVERDNVNDILTVLSELETNALHHAGGATGVRALLLDDVLRLEVDDASARSPAIRPAGANGGFGLRIVDQLAVRWGYVTSGDGKTVWAIFRAHPSRRPDWLERFPIARPTGAGATRPRNGTGWTATALQSRGGARHAARQRSARGLRASSVR